MIYNLNKEAEFKFTYANFNHEQQLVAEQLINWITDKSASKYALVSAKAGCGKTYLTTAWAKVVFEQKLVNSLVFTAPTHKATNVICKKLKDLNCKLNVKTIHSFLNLREFIDDNGNRTFLPEPYNNSFTGCQLLIIDECSMLGSELFGYLKRYESAIDKILFIGDSEQIQPINESIAMPFQIQDQILSFELKQVVRQVENNSILKLSNIIRGSFNNTYWTDNLDSSWDEIEAFKTNYEMDLFKDKVSSLFNSSAFKENSDYVKILAHKNSTVQMFNKLVRNLIPEIDNTLPFAPTDLIIAREAWSSDPGVADEGEYSLFANLSFNMRNNEELTVEEVWNGNVAISDGSAIETWDLKVKNTNGRVFTIPVMKDFERTRFAIIQDKIAKTAKEFKFERNHSKSKEFWGYYWSNKKKFALVEHNLATTVHRAQGSTYNNAIVYETEINKIIDLKERNRIKYTAITRASERLILV